MMTLLPTPVPPVRRRLLSTSRHRSSKKLNLVVSTFGTRSSKYGTSELYLNFSIRPPQGAHSPLGFSGLSVTMV